MARRRSMRTPSRERQWAGFSTGLLTFSSGALTAASSVVVPGLTTLTTVLDETAFTIARTLGFFALDVPAPGANAYYQVALGLGIINERLASGLTSGTASALIPGPISDPGFPWFWVWYGMPDSSNTAYSTSNSLQESAPFIDSKGQRIVKAGDRLLSVIEVRNTGSATGSDVTVSHALQGRLLILE